MNFEKFFDLSYLFKLNPGSPFSFYIPLIILFAVLAIFAFAVKRYIRHKKEASLKKLFKNVPKRLGQFAVSGILLLIFRQQNIPFVSMRLILILLLIGIFAFLGKTAYDYWKVYPVLSEKEKTRAKQKKYLP